MPISRAVRTVSEFVGATGAAGVVPANDLTVNTNLCPWNRLHNELRGSRNGV